MLHNKRTQIHSNIRSSEIQSLFKIRRKQLLYGSLNVFKDIDLQIIAEQPTMNQEQMCKSLVNCFHNHPDEENTYIVIGNYISWNNSTYNYFFTMLTESPRYLENQMWCLKVIACIIHEKLILDSWNHKDKIEQMEQIVTVACLNMELLFKKLKQGKHSNEKDLQMWYYFMQILRIQLNNNIFHQFSQDPIHIFTTVLSLLPVKANSEDLKEIQQTWRCLKDIILIYDKISCQHQLLLYSRNIFILVLRELSTEREDCLNILQDILIKYSVDFMGIFFNGQMLKEIFYIFEQIQELKPLISMFMKHLVPTCTLEQLLFLLNINTHKELTKAMKWSIQNRNNECLENSMGALYFMLSSLYNAYETKLLLRVKEEIESLDFFQMLEGLNQSSQNQAIQKYLSLLIDDFYSQQERL